MNLPMTVVCGMIEGVEKYEIKRKARVMTSEAKAKAARIITMIGGRYAIRNTGRSG